MMTSKCNWSGTAAITTWRGGMRPIASRYNSGWDVSASPESGSARNVCPGNARSKDSA